MAVFYYTFNIDNSGYDPVVHSLFSWAYTGTVKQGDVIRVTLHYTGNQSVNDILQFHWNSRYNLDMNSNNNSPYALGWTRVPGGNPTTGITYETRAIATGNDNYIRGFFFAKNAQGGSAAKLGVRFLMVPTDGTLRFDAGSYSAGTAGTATYRANNVLDGWMRGEYLPSTNNWNLIPSWEAFKYGSALYALSKRWSGVTDAAAITVADKGNLLHWRIVDSSGSHSPSSNFYTSSGILDSPQDGDTITIYPKASVSGTYYLNLYHYNTEGDWRNGLPPYATNVYGYSYEFIHQTSFTVSGVTAPTLSSGALQYTTGYLMPTNPVGMTPGASVVYYWSVVTRNGIGYFSSGINLGPTGGVGAEWHGSTWTVYAVATLGGNSATSNTVTFTLPTQDENVSISPQFLNSTSTYQAPILTVNSGSNNNSTIYFVSSSAPLGSLDNMYLRVDVAGQGVDFDHPNTIVSGRTFNLAASRNIRSTSGGAGAFMTDIPPEQTADTYYIYSLISGMHPVNVAYTGKSYIVERPDTSVTVTPSKTNIDSYAARARDNINVDISNDVQNTNTTYRLITVAGTKYNPYGYSQPTVEVSAANGSWVATTISSYDFDPNDGSFATNLDDWQDLPADGHFVQYQCQARIRTDRGGVGTTAAFQDCPGATFTITAGDAIVAPQTSSLTIPSPNVSSNSYTARLTLSSAGSGGGQLQYAIARNDPTLSNATYLNATSDSQITFDATFDRMSSPGTLYGHARRIMGSTIYSATAIQSITALSYLNPHLTGYYVSSPTLTSGNLDIAYSASSVTIKIMRTGGFASHYETTFKLKVGNSQVSSSTTNSSSGSISFTLSGSDLPNQGSNKSYQLTANRPVNKGGEGVDINTNLSFTITRDSEGTTTDPTDPTDPGQPTGDYGLLVYGPDGNTLILSPDYRGFNIVNVESAKTFVRPVDGVETNTAKRYYDIDVGFGANDDNLIVIVNGHQDYNGGYFGVQRDPNQDGTTVRIKSINRGLWLQLPNAQLQIGWQIIRI